MLAVNAVNSTSLALVDDPVTVFAHISSQAMFHFVFHPKKAYLWLQPCATVFTTSPGYMHNKRLSTAMISSVSSTLLSKPFWP